MDDDHSSSGEKRDFFSLFGKLMAIIIATAVLIGGGYYIGDIAKKQNSPVPTPTAMPTKEVMVTSTPSASTSPTLTTLPSKTINLPNATGSSFKAYSVKIPGGWTDTQEKTDITDKLTITKGAYSLSIYRAPIGGGGCLYPGDADQPMAQKFTDFTQVDGTTKFRISWNKTGNQPGKINYTVCSSTDGKTYGAPTSFGAITITTPDPADKDIMDEIKGILVSLKNN
ncbi:MAG TPA: hypothetical protein VG917_01645 [Patescibacteria group bacterium]|nr:hypothetical protein [Patescibacteria group bacterium]